MSRLKNVRKVLLYTLLLNVIVAFAKVLYGNSIDSISMLSDGFHSFFDGASNIVGLAGIWIASRPPDKNHPYGHRKYETLATIAIAVLIFTAGVEILRETFFRIQSPNNINVTWISFLIMGMTLAVNFSVMSYETRMGRELNSDFLIADALHTRSDIYISLSVIISLIAAKAGFSIVDVIAALIIVFFIAKMGFHILKSATSVLTDEACIEPDEIEKAAKSVTGVMSCHGIRTRGNESFVNIDLHVQVDPVLKIGEAHAVAHAVEDYLKKQYPKAIDIIIHVEPYKG
jgi:cation diffusion facilitator family transporter